MSAQSLKEWAADFEERTCQCTTCRYQRSSEAIRLSDLGGIPWLREVYIAGEISAEEFEAGLDLLAEFLPGHLANV